MGNAAILKAPFTLNDEDFTFTRAIEVAVDIEEVAKVAKETVNKPANALYKLHYKMEMTPSMTTQESPIQHSWYCCRR